MPYPDLLVTGPREIGATMFRDFAFALRTLRKTPVFAAIVVLTLALASGANATVFSILRAVVLAPLPYPESGRLVAVLGTKDAGPFSPSLPDFRDVSTRSTSFAALSAFASRNRNREIGFIFQNFNLIGNLTVAENVELPLTYRGLSTGERRRRVAEALDRVAISHRARRFPAQLADGQQQRVAVARAIAGELVMDLLAELHGGGSTIVMVTHDSRFKRYADRTIGLLDGTIVPPSTSSG